ncbi:sensor domain-containing diguanylate cyclase [Sporosarcina sp. ACRSL]|uniref:sensor domain-containing diguanylate cyclase n=1 Tax=Sporosarcina sp. ACRSL TaxID=2918215 RepID=UPI001EF41D11|nr:sensor domain-containing diguanylate cyclase [Sporosarcina sp. ACRSL]
MSEKKRSTIILFIIWLLIVPPGIIYFLITQMPENVNIMYVALFILFSVLTALYPIMYNGKPVTLVMWAALPAFLMYGIAVEIIVMQLSIVATLYATKSNLGTFERFLINSIMVFILSIVAAGGFFVVGGQIGSLDFWPLLIGVAIYRIFHTTANFGFLTAYLKAKGVKSPFTSKDIGFEYATLILILPLALTFYFLLNMVGIASFLLLGFPFFMTITIIRLYGRSEKINDYIKRAGKIGSELSVMTDEETVSTQFITKTSELFKADYVFLFTNHDQWLELDKWYEKKQFVEKPYRAIQIGEGIAGMVLEKNEPIIYSKRKDWQRYATNSAPEDLESILCIPLSRNNKTNGILLLGSTRKSAFGDYQLEIFDLLGSYYIVALEKARYVHEALQRSERCALTKLYNYRYLEEKIHFEMNRMQMGDIDNLSLIMLDIDHFKKVNDTYGHQSGNDVLYGLGRILEKALPDYGTLGRYGGEEFVFLLPDFSKEEAIDFAEQIRLMVREHAFTIIPDLGEDKYPVKVFITLSVGVANAPTDTDEAMNLLRNADRALYIGAKQAGRDRVAEYVR